MELPSQRPTPISPKRQQSTTFAVEFSGMQSGCRFGAQQIKQLGRGECGRCISKEVKTVSRKKIKTKK
jgi:hypothetical protein